MTHRLRVVPLRGQPTAAPLKPALQQKIGLGLLPLRGQPTAAPLKPATTGKPWTAAPTLRGQPTAAPLKPEIREYLNRKEQPLRGQPTAAPLKRTHTVVPVGSSGSSPRSTNRGPIEAQFAAPAEDPFEFSPRSTNRGPIEAGDHVDAVDNGCCPLRGQPTAAPLKPCA